MVAFFYALLLVLVPSLVLFGNSLFEVPSWLVFVLFFWMTGLCDMDGRMDGCPWNEYVYRVYINDGSFFSLSHSSVFLFLFFFHFPLLLLLSRYRNGAGPKNKSLKVLSFLTYLFDYLLSFSFIQHPLYRRGFSFIVVVVVVVKVQWSNVFSWETYCFFY